MHLPEIQALLHGVGLDSLCPFRENYLLHVLQAADEILFYYLDRLEFQSGYRWRDKVRCIVTCIV